MKIAIVTDAWLPQVNGVVTTLLELQQGLEARGHEVVMLEPSPYPRFACPGYREIELAWRPGRGVAQALRDAAPDAIHIATEGPMGSAARAHCLRERLAFTTAFHTRFPDYAAVRTGIKADNFWPIMRRLQKYSASWSGPISSMNIRSRPRRCSTQASWHIRINPKHPTAAFASSSVFVRWAKVMCLP